MYDGVLIIYGLKVGIQLGRYCFCQQFRICRYC